MPYISQEERKAYEPFRIFLKDMPELPNKGHLEYLVYLLMLKFMSTRPQKYGTLHEVVYAVAHCSDEYRRRFLDKREDEARESNGDIYDTIYLNEENKD